MYESLTELIPLITDATSNKTIILLENRINQFVEKHHEYELNCYAGILNQNGLEWGADSMMHADVSALDGGAVMALLVGTYRADRYCRDFLVNFCQNGCVRKWLLRLAEIDDADR